MTDQEIKLRIAGVTPESVVDGPGLRAVVFFQGCPHHCPGCHNPETWDPAGGKLLSVQEVWSLLRYNPLLSGITLSGGEPLAQPEGALAIARKVRAVQGNLMIYTGYTWEELLEMASPSISELISLTDLLVDGPFLLAEKDEHLAFRGSRNQRIINVQASLGKARPVLWASKGGTGDALGTAGS
ncbi:MAG TPA: anaerobic ribonucleoside-triphosphate reductase activating protein [Firmicutes bacterium]|jgi:anaerobic ribonucleoside-triphosphate reductase activating protein|nr:anaerobic ribonucleoside-triphosphate reductase activating protein [Bacillota bacterium]